MASTYTRTWATSVRQRLLVIRNQIIATRTGLELSTPPGELLPDIEQSIRELTVIRNQMRRMVENSPDRAFTLPGERI
jgi:hypothetical protein